MCCEDADILRKIAKEILEPLYGDQSKAFNEWMTGAGFKRAFVAVWDGNIVGLLSLKVNPDKPFLKISTLLIISDHQGKGYGRQMLAFAESFAREYGYRILIVTTSETKSESVSFFAKNGFTIIARKIGKYREGVTEFVMRKELLWET